MKGLISDIQKFSLHDGPGIRTTVFLKGCNMRCIWCHNPEAIPHRPQIAEYPEKCIGCGQCIGACRYGAIRNEGGVRVFDRSACVECGACTRVCPAGAMVVIGTWREVNDVFAELAADIPYYGNSGGGLTISGGEPLMQADFCAELLRRCREAGIHTAIETNLSLPFGEMEKLLPWLDLVFFDIKLMDDTAHKKYTGVSNAVVLSNSRKIDQVRIPLVVRTPVIPGITDAPENIRAIAEWAGTLANLEYYELLNYNVLAKAKYAAIGLDYSLPDVRPLPEEDMERLTLVAKDTGVKTVYRKG